MKDNPIRQCLNEKVAKFPHVYGFYVLDKQDIVSVIEEIVKVAATLYSPDCGKCIEKLIADIQSSQTKQ